MFLFSKTYDRYIDDEEPDAEKAQKKSRTMEAITESRRPGAQDKGPVIPMSMMSAIAITSCMRLIHPE